MKKFSYILVTSAIILSPMFVFAAGKDLSSLINLASDYLQKGLLLLMGVAVVLFVYNVVKYYMKDGDNKAEGAKYVGWSVLGFFVIFSMWGLVNILINTFELDNTKRSVDSYINTSNQSSNQLPTSGDSQRP